MTHFQRRKDYGRHAVHDEAIEDLLNDLHSTYGREPTFTETILEISKRYNENPSTKSIHDLQVDFDLIPSNITTFFHQLLNLSINCPHTAAACLDTSSLNTALYRPATGGVKETKRPHRAAFFIDRFISRYDEFVSREETPFATLKAFAADPKNLDFSDFVCRYELFLDEQESDGRLQSQSYPNETVARAMLLCLTLAESPIMTAGQQRVVSNWMRKLSDFFGKKKLSELQIEYVKFVSTMNNDERTHALMCTLAGRNFVVERPGIALACYYWDSDSLLAVRTEFQNYSEDTNGAKLHGCHRRMLFAWMMVLLGLTLAVLSGTLNWAGRDNKFERVNDVFQTFLLILAVPGFTVKLAATNGEQAIKDWLVGARRIRNMEQLEQIVHRRVKGNRRRAWLALQRVKCETDDKQNWTAADNMCYKTAHKDGSVRARKDRNMAELELVFGTNGTRARSWTEISNETNILGRDVNHLQFTCGATLQTKTTAFFTHTPSKRVWFA